MRCEACRELLTAYLKAELEVREREGVEEHLATCAECARECEGARGVLARLDSASEEPIVRMVTVVIEKAVAEGASDIHIRVMGGHCSDMYRVDGVMREVMRLPDYVHQPTVDRLKLMAGMRLTEQQLPQEGRIAAEVGGKRLDLRVSSVPAVGGTSLVMRILPPELAKLTLEQVGVVGQQREEVDRLIKAPYGMVFVTGPAGSGKTTTLYAMLNELNRPHLHVMTIENPVNYQLEGVTQISVNPEAGLDFKTAMRHVLMQDPDIIMCSEIRDFETLELCFQASLWGHLVISTQHTLDAVTCMRRVLDVGAERFIVSQALVGATAQRLLRRVCGACKEAYEPSAEEVAWLREAGVAEAPVKLWRGRGCEECKQTGHRGRTTAYEVFYVDEDIRGLLASDTPVEEIERLARGKVKPMRVAAAAKVVAGEVDAAEAMRVMACVPGRRE